MNPPTQNTTPTCSECREPLPAGGLPVRTTDGDGWTCPGRCNLRHVLAHGAPVERVAILREQAGDLAEDVEAPALVFTIVSDEPEAGNYGEPFTVTGYVLDVGVDGEWFVAEDREGEPGSIRFADLRDVTIAAAA